MAKVWNSSNKFCQGSPMFYGLWGYKIRCFPDRRGFKWIALNNYFIITITIIIDNRKAQGIKRNWLVKKYNIEKKNKIWINWLKSSNIRLQQRREQLSRYRKRQNHYYQYKLFRQTAWNFITVSGRHIPMWKMHQTKRRWRTSGEKYMGKKFNIMERRTGLKTSTNKIQAWNGAQYVKKTLQRH